MRLKELHLKNFRCFSSKALHFQNDLILITGHNGSGKTSVLEALYYLGYLHSFRTHNARELIKTDHQDFFIRASVDTVSSSHEIQVGFSDKKRIVRVDQKAINSYKELMGFYRIISLTEDDIELVRGEPEVRRAFLDQTCMLINPETVGHVRAYRAILHNRNKLLIADNHDNSMFSIWTEQLWQQARIIQAQREHALTELDRTITALAQVFFDADFSVSLVYQPKIALGHSFSTFIDTNSPLFANERRYGRSLFGTHLDDFHLYFAHKKSRIFASRGQQKCSVTLLKLAQILLTLPIQGPSILALDDFMTDFDDRHMQVLLDMLMAQNIQLIFTIPTREGALASLLALRGAQQINISD